MSLAPYDPSLPYVLFSGGWVDLPAVRSFLIAFVVSFLVCSLFNRLFSR